MRNVAITCPCDSLKAMNGPFQKYALHGLGQLLLKIGQLELNHLPNLPKKLALLHLSEAAEIIQVTHGVGHPLFELVQAEKKIAEKACHL